MKNRWFRIASGLMLLGVLMGAFGAHALKSHLSAELLEVYHTAVFYQFIHAIGLFIVSYTLSISVPPKRAITAAGFCFLFGILIFSGSLYILALTGIRWIGAFTPIGGLLFMFGWGSLAFSS